MKKNILVGAILLLLVSCGGSQEITSQSHEDNIHVSSTSTGVDIQQMTDAIGQDFISDAETQVTPIPVTPTDVTEVEGEVLFN